MQILPNGMVRISNKNTGQVKDVKPEELDSYGAGLSQTYASLKGQPTPTATPPATPTPPASDQMSNVYTQPPPAPKPVDPSKTFTQSASDMARDVGLGFIPNILANVTDIGKSIAAGKKLKVDDSYYNPFRTKDEMTKTLKSNPIISGLKDTAGAASWATPVGGSLKAAAGLGAVSGALQGLSEDDPTLQGVAGSAVTGGILGPANKLVGKAVKGAGNALKGSSERAITKGLNLTPTQETTVIKKMGESSLPDFLQKRGLGNGDHATLSKYEEALQGHYDSVAEHPDLVVNPKTVSDNLQSHIDTLRASTLPSDHVKAETLEETKKLFDTKYGETPVAGTDMTALKREIDKTIKTHHMEPATKGSAELYRDAIMNAINDTADSAGLTTEDGSTLKSVGNELRKVRTLTDLTEKRELAGSNKPLFGMKDWLSLLGGNALGGPGAAVAALASEKALGTKTGQKVVGKAQGALGNILEKDMSAVQKPTRALEQGGGSFLGNILVGQQGDQSTQGQTPDNNANSVNHINDSVPQTQPIVNSQPQTGGSEGIPSRDVLEREYFKALQVGTPQGRATASSLLDAIKSHYPVANQKVSQQEYDRKQLGYGVATAIGMLDGASKPKIGPFGINSQIEELKGNVDKGDQPTLNFNKVISELAASIAKARGGTSFTPNEQKMLDRYTPHLGDSEQQMRTKLQQLKEKVDYFNNVQIGSDATQSQTPNMGSVYAQ